MSNIKTILTYHAICDWMECILKYNLYFGSVYKCTVLVITLIVMNKKGNSYRVCSVFKQPYMRIFICVEKQQKCVRAVGRPLGKSSESRGRGRGNSSSGVDFY